MDGRRGMRREFADAALAVAVGALVLAAAGLDADPGAGAADQALLVAASLALAGRRAAPRVTLAVSAAAGTAYVVHAQPALWAALPVLGAVHTAAWAGHPGLAAGAGAVFLGGYATGGPGAALLLAGWFLCAVAAGIAARGRQDCVRLAERCVLAAERVREEAALRRAGEERLRIARELHESLNRSVSVVRLQAGVAVHLARKRGEDVPPALVAIQEASGDALRELRATLGELDADEGAVPPALLVERARAAGLAASLTVTGEERPLAPAVERVACRIVQEALANAARHAGGARVDVRLDYGADALAIRVDDDGRADPARPPRPGGGLTGMRERAAALCGTLHAAPRAEGGFSVRAELPLGEGALGERA